MIYTIDTLFKPTMDGNKSNDEKVSFESFTIFFSYDIMIKNFFIGDVISCDKVSS